MIYDDASVDFPPTTQLWMTQPRILITGASGMIGAPVAIRAARLGMEVTVVARAGSDLSPLSEIRYRTIEADLTQPSEDVAAAVRQSDFVVHTAAQVGDWGPKDWYRAINLDAVDHLLRAAASAPDLKRFLHLSALGVYKATHHHGTDESAATDLNGFDGYTHTKALSEVMVNDFHKRAGIPTTIVRPGFTYGIGDRRILPRLITTFENNTIRQIGDGMRVLNNTHIDNVVDGIFLALDNDAAIGETFNMRDERLVTRHEFLGAIAEYLGKPHPRRVPEWFARGLHPVMETFARLRRSAKPPLLTGATMKFMVLNLNFSIDKAKRLLGYEPKVDFRDGIREALDWSMAHRHDDAIRPQG
ncbi:MAG: NAD(P)-dependent oxidoreductase [Planctomycetota bacterium]